MTRRLLLARHGQTEAGRGGRLIGASDFALDQCGQSQVRALAGRVRRWAPQACYSSPLQRCRQTALVVAADLPIEFDDALREIDFGRWENRTFEQMACEDRELAARWAALAPDLAFPGGESLAGFLARVHAAADRLAHEDAETLLIVSHGGVIRTMLCHLLGLEARSHVAFDVGHATLAVVDLFDGCGVLAALERPEPMEPGNQWVARPEEPTAWLAPEPRRWLRSGTRHPARRESMPPEEPGDG